VHVNATPFKPFSRSAFASTLKLTFNSFSKNFELNILFSQNLATPTEESDQWEERKEKSDLLEGSIQI
jgi:hypothetical protein